MGLYPGGVGDYAGSDCGHGSQGAVSDRGDLVWYYGNKDGTYNVNGKYVIINNVTFNGLPIDPTHGNFSPYVTTLTIPRSNGHYTGTDTSFLTLPYFIEHDVGFTQLQVAP